MYKTLQFTSPNAYKTTANAIIPTMVHCGLQPFRFIASLDTQDTLMMAVVKSAGDMAESVAALAASLPKGVRVEVLPAALI